MSIETNFSVFENLLSNCDSLLLVNEFTDIQIPSKLQNYQLLNHSLVTGIVFDYVKNKLILKAEFQRTMY